MAQSSAAIRPFSVTLMVILVWLNAILTIGVGTFLVLQASNATVLDQFNGDADAAKVTGWFLVALGLVIALVAIGLSKGSGFMRMLITILLVLRLAADVYVIFATKYDVGAAISILFTIFLLWLLWNSKAGEFFANA